MQGIWYGLFARTPSLRVCITMKTVAIAILGKPGSKRIEIRNAG
ncbi:hypothetical protein [Burkholderia lata]|nr:hypothetical protein [Burkholderia lata]